MNAIMKKSSLLLGCSILLSQVAMAAQPIDMILGQTRRLTLNSGRQVEVSCSQFGGPRNASQIGLALGSSVQVVLYGERSNTLITCSSRVPVPQPQPPQPQPPRPNPNPPQPPRPQPQPPRPMPPGSRGAEVVIFSTSDSCSGTVLDFATLYSGEDLADQCRSQLRNPNSSAWSIRVNGQCVNIADTTAISACAQADIAAGPGDTQVTVFSNSDSCSGNVSGSALLRDDDDLQDRCSRMNRVSGNSGAWSIRVNGQCVNIADTDAVSGCLNARVPSRRGAHQVTIFSNSDSCSGSVSASGFIDPRYSPMAQCQALRQNGSNRAGWSVRVDNRCINVADTDFVSACMNAGI